MDTRYGRIQRRIEGLGLEGWLVKPLRRLKAVNASVASSSGRAGTTSPVTDPATELAEMTREEDLYIPVWGWAYLEVVGMGTNQQTGAHPELRFGGPGMRIVIRPSPTLMESWGRASRVNGGLQVVVALQEDGEGIQESSPAKSPGRSAPASGSSTAGGVQLELPLESSQS